MDNSALPRVLGKVKCCSRDVIPAINAHVCRESLSMIAYVSFECEACDRVLYLVPRKGKTLAQALDEVANHTSNIDLAKVKPNRATGRHDG